MPIRSAICLLPLLAAFLACAAAEYRPANVNPPQPPREFRGLWIATVSNLDWPSRRNLSTAAQQAELISILDRAVQLRLNAVILQVRPASDTFYSSANEPWSEYLTGTMGRAPDPFYDPLSFAITEAHRRGLELHAWFNPYRGLHRSHAGPIATNHISQKRPDLIRKMVGTDGTLLLLDPGERDVRDYCVGVILDVVKRYDLDGVQIDDYFYPATEGPFPDEASWRRFGVGSSLSRDDWRRENVNAFVERVYRSIKSAKPWVKFGVSPRGIWRPGHPPQIRGSDDFADHFADTRKWLANGWLDYFAPQLYWRIDDREHSYPALLKWWSEQNRMGRHLWPGLAAYNAGPWSSEEIPNQIRMARNTLDSDGYMLFRAQNVLQNSTLMRLLQTQLNTTAALVPASPWLATNAPGPPALRLETGARGFQLHWRHSGSEPVRFWLLQTMHAKVWHTRILPAQATTHRFEDTVEAIAITAISRAGIAGPPSALLRHTTPQPPRRNVVTSPKNSVR